MVLDMDSRGGYNTVDIRDEITSGRVQGPRMQVVGNRSILARPIIIRTSARAASRKASLRKERERPVAGTRRRARGETARRRLGENLHDSGFRRHHAHVEPEATLVNSPSLTFEEVQAIVDEAHRLGLKVACHTYGGEGMASCLNAGVDAPNHLLELAQDGIKVLLEKKLPFVVTLDDLIALEKEDLEATGGRNSRMKLVEQAFRRAIAPACPSSSAAAPLHPKFHTASRPTSSPIT